MLRNEKHNEFYWKSKRASPQLMSHPFCVAMAAWRWAIITVHPQRAGHDGEIWAVSAAPESMTPECKQQAGAEDGAPTTARKPLLGGPQKERAVWAFIEQWATSMCNMPIKMETYNKLKKLIYWRCECACEYPSFNCRYNTHTQHPVSPNPKETEEILKDVDWGRKKKKIFCVWGEAFSVVSEVCWVGKPKRTFRFNSSGFGQWGQWVRAPHTFFCLEKSLICERASLTSMPSMLPKWLIWFGDKAEEADAAASFQKWERIAGKDGESSGKRTGEQDQHRSTVLLGGPG